MRHVEVVAPRCNRCHTIYVVRYGRLLMTSTYEFGWYPDCKCKGSDPEVVPDKSGQPRMFSLDRLCPQQTKASARD